MTKARIAINGFGRMGRAALRVATQRDLGIEVVAVNELGAPETMLELLRRDSVHGRFASSADLVEGGIEVDGRLVHLSSASDPMSLPWSELGVDVVLEATGHFRTRDTAAAHLDAGAHRVIVSAPCKGADATFVLGVNDADFDPARHLVISNASCTTNCLVPMVHVLHQRFGIVNGLMTTVHAYTGDQSLVDGPHKDARRARAAAINIVPTTTGAARATSQVIAELDGRLDGAALRVPVADGSITDLVVQTDQDVTVEAVNEAFAAAADGALEGVLDYATAPIVSSDIVGSAASCVFDAALTMTSGHLIKVFGWYDNEWGYANRLVELAAMVATH